VNVSALNAGWIESVAGVDQKIGVPFLLVLRHLRLRPLSRICFAQTIAFY
jgi:hypothetical protein